MNSIIIGPTQGLGLALTKKFLAMGHVVAAGVVERATPAALAALQGQYGDRLLVFPADVSNEEEIAAAAQRCTDFFGPAGALINVAGVLLAGDRERTIDACSLADLRKTFEVNAFGAIAVAKHFRRVMKPGGNLFTVTSEGTGLLNAGTWIPCYALSKTAATKAMGMFNAAVPQVSFFAVHPGRMNTEMGRTTAQIEPEESAEGFYRLATGETATDREQWYIDYLGNPLPA